MLIDGRTLPGDQALATDLCIIGAGAAGITVALAFADQPINVCLIEAGAFDFDAEGQELYRAETVGTPYEGYDTRMRMFGGSTNHWGGWCRPMEERTFEARPWIPYSGWPIRRADLAPYYDAAASLCEVGGVDLGPEHWAARLGLPSLTLDGSPLRNMMFQVSPPTRFGEAYRQRLMALERLTICLNSSVTGFERADGAEIARVRVQTLTGNQFKVAARCFVLACGGIENARLLLCSKQSEGGLTDLPDCVGRFFMEHAHFNLGRLARARHWDPRLYLEITPANGAVGMLVNAHLGFRPEIEEREQLPIVAFQIRPRVPSAGEKSLERIWGSLRQGRYPDDFGSHLMRVLTDLGPVSELVEHKLAHRLFGTDHEASPLLALRSVGEQVPNPDSRIMLADTKDALGLPKALIDWRLAELDRIMLRRSGEILAAAFGQLELGRMQLAITADTKAETQFIEWGYHHIGTTRMHDDPAQGVVDRHCRLHVAPNLYVAGSSVFTTGGAGTPTMTLVALALRLADHLKTGVFA